MKRTFHNAHSIAGCIAEYQYTPSIVLCARHYVQGIMCKALCARHYVQCRTLQNDDKI